MSEAAPSVSRSPLPSPGAARRRLEGLRGIRKEEEKELQRSAARLAEIGAYLAIADAVDGALDRLSEDLFRQITGVLEEKLSLALGEILDQPIALKAERSYKRGSATISFHIERGGEREHILQGQGGSVTNILSVGLRMFALATLDPAKHRAFLVLDEQDCWLRPDLVPRLVKIVHEAARALGFQVLLISHHDTAIFERHADRILKLTPAPEGVQVTEWQKGPATADGG